jgi:hypothetical protein
MPLILPPLILIISDYFHFAAIIDFRQADQRHYCRHAITPLLPLLIIDIFADIFTAIDTPLIIDTPLLPLRFHAIIYFIIFISFFHFIIIDIFFHYYADIITIVIDIIIFIFIILFSY